MKSRISDPIPVSTPLNCVFIWNQTDSFCFKTKRAHEYRIQEMFRLVAVWTVVLFRSSSAAVFSYCLCCWAESLPEYK